jgi:glycolate oxidase iron-sulfur subunit
MQTNLADWIKDTPEGQEADSILRKCVHCGFCLATCPTYNLLGDELDSPRGRIYLMKQMLEGEPVTEKTQLHLDRCLTCRSCESTCPSGVQYGRLVDIGRVLVEKKVGRGVVDGIKRGVLKKTLPETSLFSAALSLGRMMKPLLPAALASKIPQKRDAGVRPAPRHARNMLVLEGCVQPAIGPNVNSATARVLDRLGISLIAAPQAGCCGSLPQHLGDIGDAHAFIKRNIDAWWPYVEAGAEAVVVTASGCGTMVAEYGHALRHDSAYAEKAAKISSLFRDVSQVIAAEAERLSPLLRTAETTTRVAFHSPCTLQHGLQIRGVVEGLLRDAGFELTAVPDGHLCCGSAGTYSILQPELSKQLRGNKIAALTSATPAVIASANVACMAHLESGLQGKVPVRHWIELIDERLVASSGNA